MDYSETHAPVTRLESIRTLLALAAYEDWEVRQIDVKTAYLYGNLEEEIYMDVPEGMTDIPEGHCLLLVKALYGLKQARRQWYQTLKGVVKEFGMKQLPSDPHTYIAHRTIDGKKRTLILPVYVNNLLPIGDKVLTNDFEANIGTYFQVTPACDALYILGIRVQCDRPNRRLSLDQVEYAKRVLARFIHKDSSHLRARTPFPTKSVFANKEDQTGRVKTVKAFQSAVGALMYLMMGTRPDLAYAIGKLGSFAANPSDKHIKLIRRVFFYLVETKHLHLRYQPESLDPVDYSVYGYSDSDFAEKSTKKRKSILGYVFYLGDAATSWRSKKQETTATSTTEAEYIALYHACANALWLRNLYEQIDKPMEGPILVFCDNDTARLIASGEAPHAKVKHINTKYHQIRLWINRKQVEVTRIDTDDNFADIMTKPLARDRFSYMAGCLGLVSVAASPIPDNEQLEYLDKDEDDSVYVDAEDNTGI